MHLVYENVLKNLVSLWTGNFKDMDTGQGDYEFEPGVWESIGAATAACGAHIPSTFASNPPNVADDKQATTADSWSFWMLYIAPIVLENKFRRKVYYDHFIELVKLVQICLKFSLSSDDIERLRTGFKDWVVAYEKLYYQNNPSRARACPLTIHALLHIADLIKVVGPVWTYWAFPTERYCGRLQPAIRSRRHPFVSIDNYVSQDAQLSHIKMVYNVHDRLTIPRRLRNPDVVRGIHDSHPDYPLYVLLGPKRTLVDPSVHAKVRVHLATRFGKPLSMILQVYDPQDVVQWGCVRRLEGGDDMKAAELTNLNAEDRRDATFVRYELLVDIAPRSAASNFVARQFYGQLKNILVVKLPASTDLNLSKPTTYMLALIHQSDAKVASISGLDIPYYKKLTRKEVVDVATIQCLVGRVPPSALLPASQSRGWGIIDRSGTIARGYYIPDD
ncbi:hypothetical protein CYLTODRAFT_433611 [Cylindrobasidium torrendii FP15055 ss-10]|uniref:Uncharacterized protein n=1 Tax=Cylindrobasidium torrendii FP15055 ss-10 TaxID=1314674 RepID=A0A0D7AT82_9AGAR|nr:hypothetical protein CYLTODRAFT_433611 [Cylindrobasidium torrendii FP15055 ss-10]